MNAPIQSTEPDTHASAPESPPWLLQIDAEPEPLLLSRILQKLAVPEITVTRVSYGIEGAVAHAGLSFRARPGRARLAAVRLEKIIGIRTVALRRLPGG